MNEFRREVRRKMWTFVKLRIDAELYEKAAPSRQNTKKINDFIICFKLDLYFFPCVLISTVRPLKAVVDDAGCARGL